MTKSHADKHISIIDLLSTDLLAAFPKSIAQAVIARPSSVSIWTHRAPRLNDSHRAAGASQPLSDRSLWLSCRITGEQIRERNQGQSAFSKARGATGCPTVVSHAGDASNMCCAKTRGSVESRISPKAPSPATSS